MFKKRFFNRSPEYDLSDNESINIYLANVVSSVSCLVDFNIEQSNKITFNTQSLIALPVLLKNRTKNNIIQQLLTTINIIRSIETFYDFSDSYVIWQTDYIFYNAQTQSFSVILVPVNSCEESKLFSAFYQDLLQLFKKRKVDTAQFPSLQQATYNSISAFCQVLNMPLTFNGLSSIEDVGDDAAKVKKYEGTQFSTADSSDGSGETMPLDGALIFSTAQNDETVLLTQNENDVQAPGDTVLLDEDIDTAYEQEGETVLLDDSLSSAMMNENTDLLNQNNLSPHAKDETVILDEQFYSDETAEIENTTDFYSIMSETNHGLSNEIESYFVPNVETVLENTIGETSVLVNPSAKFGIESEPGNEYFTLAKKQSVARLLFQSSGQALYLNNDHYKIGSNEYFADYVVHNPNVSKLHLSIYKKDGKFFIKDHKSTNGTKLNNYRIEPNLEYEIHEGDRIIIANEIVDFEILED